MFPSNLDLRRFSGTQIEPPGRRLRGAPIRCNNDDFPFVFDVCEGQSASLSALPSLCREQEHVDPDQILADQAARAAVDGAMRTGEPKPIRQMSGLSRCASDRRPESCAFMGGFSDRSITVGVQPRFGPADEGED